MEANIVRAYTHEVYRFLVVARKVQDEGDVLLKK
jgi:hypothetical protein